MKRYVELVYFNGHSYLCGLCFMTPGGCLRLQLVFLLNIIFSLKESTLRLLFVLNCHHHYFCALGLLSKLRIT